MIRFVMVVSRKPSDLLKDLGDITHWWNKVVMNHSQTLVEQLSVEKKLSHKSELLPFFARYASWLPAYDDDHIDNLLPTFGHKETLKKIHKEMSYLLAVHPSIQKTHPLFFPPQKYRIDQIGHYIDGVESLPGWIEHVQHYFYRAHNMGELKKTFLVQKIEQIYVTESRFLRDNFHETILVDLLQSTFADGTVLLASNIDDRAFGFDAVVLNTKDRVKFIDFTFKYNKDALLMKKNKIQMMIDQKSYFSSEFAIRLYEQHGASLHDKKVSAAVAQVQVDKFYQHILPNYLLHHYYGTPYKLSPVDDLFTFHG